MIASVAVVRELSSQSIRITATDGSELEIGAERKGASGKIIWPREQLLNYNLIRRKFIVETGTVLETLTPSKWAKHLNECWLPL
ncbi:MAG: hypothetical protein NXH95_17350 [Pseudomonadaceae bacterium]|nr:hypothetical protein [Pseudomonadaceae bacterium]